MRDDSDRLAALIGLFSLFNIGLCLANLWELFGLGLWSLMFLCLALGYGGQSRKREVWAPLAGLLCCCWLLFGAIVWFHGRDADLRLFLGVPRATSFLIYGVWPAGFVLGILYFRVFRRAVLPQDKLNRFLSDFSRQKSAR